MLAGKKIILGISGGIAAYKSILTVRLLVKAGAEVQVMVTPSALSFVSPLTLATLSKRPVLSDYFDEKTGVWNNHVEWGLWADALIIAPATANTLSKMATGQADSLLLATYLSARCPVWVSPAMDLDMYLHPATRRNLDQLVQDGVSIIPAETGELASGLYGEGRMAEPENQIIHLENHFRNKESLEGISVLITAGPTYEKIDPVRFIGNYSSGKMGFALAKELAHRGAQVELVSGPTSQEINHKNVRLTRVESAEQMAKACHQYFPNCQWAIMAAAVADYKPVNPADQKIKKSVHAMELALEPTQDILKSLGHSKAAHQKVIGFALETQDEEENARKKLIAKKADMIVLNSLNDEGAGFKTDTNKITLITALQTLPLPLMSKAEAAIQIIDQIQSLEA